MDRAHVTSKNTRHQYLLGTSSFAEKDLGVVVNIKLSMSQQYVLASNKEYAILGCLRQSIATKSRKVMLPHCSALVKGVLCPALSSSVQDKYGHAVKSPTKNH